MRRGLFWLNDKQWAQIEPHLPTNQTGPARDDDRRIISGIIHRLQCGARWRDCPPDYGPCTTIYNRFNRWAKRGRWQAIFEARARCGKDGVTLSIDSTSIKAHRSASGGKGGSMNRRSAARAVEGPDLCGSYITGPAFIWNSNAGKRTFPPATTFGPPHGFTRCRFRTG